MSRKAAPKALFIRTWAEDFEPRHKTLMRPLIFHFEPVNRSGEGRRKLTTKYGCDKMLQAVGFFDIIKRLSADLPRELRGFVINKCAQPNSFSSHNEYLDDLGQELRIARPLFDECVSMLRYAKWLVLRPYVLNGNPMRTRPEPDRNPADPDGHPRPRARPRGETKTKTERGEGSPVSSGDATSASQSASVEDMQGQITFAEQLCKTLRISPLRATATGTTKRSQIQADLENVRRIVRHLWGNRPGIDRLAVIAEEVASDDKVRNPISVLNQKLKSEDLFYKKG